MKVAAVQMTSKPDVGENLRQAEGFIREAAERGVEYIITPENTDLMINNRLDHLDEHYPMETHPGIGLFSSLSKELGIYLQAGSFQILDTEQSKLRNRSFLFNPNGNLQTTYDKIHLFDVDLPTGENHRESKTIIAGDRLGMGQVADVPVGLAICYDLRFPHLFRDMAKKGAKIITVPAAFTVPTGQAHWHVLLRARAIEAGVFIVAPAQVGQHTDTRFTFGHSLIINPWGEVLAEAKEDEPSYIIADLDMSLVEKAHHAIPSLQHDRIYQI
jgi:deaminated glutathione amidase